MGRVRTLRTERLLLRGWRTSDREPFAALNADPVVMELMPARLSRAESDDLADRIDTGLRERGWGLWAVEVPGAIGFAGFVGLDVPGFEAPFTPCVEIGWRLRREAWGHGYATEGARAVLDVAWRRAGHIPPGPLADLGLDQVVSFTSVANRRSRRVMERIGLTHDPADDFDHPNLPEGHPLRRHVLYRGRRPAV